MSRFLTLVLLAAVSASIAPPATHADEPPAADKASAEAVLGDAGLRRISNSYVLQEEIAAYDLDAEIKKLQVTVANRMSDWRALDHKYRSRSAEASRLSQAARKLTSEYNPETKRYEQRETTDESKLSELRHVENEMERIRLEAGPIEQEIAAGRREIQEHLARQRMLVSRALGGYARLAARPEIKAALRELNRGTHPKLALGPIADYRQNLARQSVETLLALGFRRERDRYCLPDEAGFIKRSGQARMLWREVAMHERRLESPGTATTRPITTSPVPSRPPVDVAPAHGAARPAPAPATKPLTPAEIAAKRAELARRVRELRQQADALQERRDALLADGEALDALEEINRASRKARQAKLGTDVGWTQGLQGLEDMERAIRTEEVPLTRDGNLLKVDAHLNGKLASLVVDPAAEWVKLPDHLASELGVQPAPDARTVSLDLGGRAVRARLAKIPSLQVGSIAEEGVACLVLPPGSGAGPPVLGASFLNRVVAELDGESATLTLTRVSPPPAATPGKPSNKSKGKAS